MNSRSDSYKSAGVDITAGYEAVRRMRAHVERTRTPGVLSGIGGFGGLFLPNFSGMREPVLVSGTDGVGTKLKLAFHLDKHDTVGVDCVAMCVNDIVCSGAKPLFFLDYIACGKNDPARIEAIVAGVAEGCVQAGCALVGGETAEMPGFYSEDEYDLAGFAVGAVDRAKLLDNAAIRPGDALIALPSSGVHSNGFSLIRHVYPHMDDSLAQTLLTPTRIYVKPVLALLDAVRVKGLSHITGGGFYENIPRCLPDGLLAKIDKQSLQTPEIFRKIKRDGSIPERDMYNTFNMGVGMCAVVGAEDANATIAILRESGVDAYACGEVAEGEGGLTLC